MMMKAKILLILFEKDCKDSRIKKNKEIVKEQDFVPITKKELAVKKPTSPKKSKNKHQKSAEKTTKRYQNESLQI